MKTFILFTLLLFPALTFSQTVNELFLQFPNEIIEVLTVNRPKIIIETTGDLLKFRLSEARQGEFKIVAQKKNEIIIGMSVSNCEESSLRFWKVKNGVWKETTNSIIKPLGKKDITQILKVSPANITNSNQTLGITTYYKFNPDSSNIQLIARKQNSCEIAGKIYEYKFNGKTFVIQK
jgi:hypothetical protein